MSLPIGLVERLEAALLDAFRDDDALDKLIRRVGMQVRIPARAALAARIGKLVEVVDAQGRLRDLLDAACELAPGNALLAEARSAILEHAEQAHSVIPVSMHGKWDAAVATAAPTTSKVLPTRLAAGELTTPIPAYASAEVEALSKQLEDARARKQNLRNAGIATDEVDLEILELRRRLRDGGQLRAGDSLGDGRYLLVKPLGRGGFAVVWEAWDHTEKRRVAIKVLHQHLASEAQRRERFFRGARVMMDLDHPAVVRVYDPRGEDERFCYFVMELVSGGNLREAVLGNRVEAGSRLTLVLQVGEALAKAHRSRLVHRDVKPANILLDEHGNAKLTDFDLVGAHDTTGGTRTGALGTVVYAAPECLDKPQNASARADVFGLGMTGIFCLSGKDLTMDTLRDTAEALAQLNCTAPVRKVLERAVEWKPDRRFADAATMIDALRHALDTDNRTAGSVQREADKTPRFNPRYTFATFVIGPSNNIAFAASQTAASSDPPKYNPIFLYGGVGLGKTHLLHAIGNQRRAERPSARIVYISSERFTNEYVQAIRTGRQSEFRRHYCEGIDLLLVDDVQFLAGKESTQDEFFHVFNALRENQKQVVLTAGCRPQDIPDLYDPLRSRVAEGFLVDIYPPELEVRIAILRRKAAVESIVLPDDVALYIASSSGFGVRELEGALIRLAAYATLSKRVINLEFAQDALGAALTGRRELSKVDSGPAFSGWSSEEDETPAQRAAREAEAAREARRATGKKRRKRKG
jgi:chromosomal replication initiator protein DnaA